MWPKRCAPEPPSPAVARAVLLAHALAVALGFVGLAGAWHWAALNGAEEELIYPLCVLLLGLCVWSLVTWRVAAGMWFDPYSVFLLAAFAFNGGQAFLEVFGLNEKGLLAGKFSPALTAQTLLLVALGLGVMHLGALLSAAWARRPDPPEDAPAEDEATQTAVRRVGWALLLISAPFAVMLARDAVGVVLSSGYAGLYQREAATGVGAMSRVLAEFLVPGTLFLLAGSKGRPWNVALSAAVILGNAACQLFLGSRWAAALPMVAYVWLFHVRIRPVPRALLFGGAAFLLVVVFPLIRLTRNLSGEERMSATTLAAAFSTLDNPAVSMVQEMGFSMTTVAYTLELVPATRDFDQGVVYAYALTTAAPNLFWEIHPAVAYGTPSQWLVWAVDPWMAARGGSLGYSFIAEAYFCFGWVGVPVVTGLVGLLFAAFVLWARRPGGAAAVRLATVAAFAAFFTFYAREEAAFIVRPLVWYSLLPFALVLLLARSGATGKSKLREGET